MIHDATIVEFIVSNVLQINSIFQPKIVEHLLQDYTSKFECIFYVSIIN